MYNTHAEWITAVRDFLDLDDYSDDQIDTFLKLGNSRLNRDLKVREMEKTSLDVPYPNGVIDILADIPDFGRIKDIFLSGDYDPLESLDEANYFKKRGSTSSGGPKFYCIIGHEIFLWPATINYEVNIVYYEKVPFLAESTQDTNTFTLYHSDIFLSCVCEESGGYTNDEEVINYWGPKSSNLIERANQDSEDQKFGSAPLKRRQKGLS